MKTHAPIPMTLHAINDLFALGFLLASPWLSGFEEHAAATMYTLSLAVFVLLMNLVSDYPLGALRVLPFRWHRLIELISPPLFIVIPWVFFGDAGLMPWMVSLVGALLLVNAGWTRETRA